MSSLHLICKFDGANPRGLYLVDKESRLWGSGQWDISEKEAALVVGGNLYLHETKDSPAYFGGKVKFYELNEVPELARSERITFIFEYDEAARGKSWSGQGHSMAWSSGVVE